MVKIPGQITKYRILRTLEKSNYSIVYRAEDPHRRPLIIKCAKANLNHLNNLISREFQILSRLKHPGIVAVHDYGIDAALGAFFTMDEITGLPLNRHFRGYSPQLTAVLLQILDALASFHEQDFVHGDLKPEHIIFNPERRQAVIIDFGFAGISRRPAGGGTMGYIAPEILKGINQDQRSDLYSLGVIMYEIVAGQKPKTPLTDLPGLPDDLNRLLHRLLASEPALRPAWPEIRHILEKHCGGPTRATKPYRVDLPTTVFIPPDGIELDINPGTAYFFTGETGSGKTRLLKEMRYQLQMNQRLVLSFTGADQESLVCAAAQLSETKMEEISETGGRFAALEAITRSLLKICPATGLVIMIDDIDLMNEEDRAFAAYLGYAIKDTNIALVVSGRSGTWSAPSGWLIKNIPAWSPAEIQQLLEKTFVPLEIKGRQDLAGWLWRHSGGLPLFVVELIRTLHQSEVLVYQDHRWLVAADQLDLIPVPARIHNALEEKYRQLAGPARQLFDCLTVINAAVDADVLEDIMAAPISQELEQLKYHGYIQDELSKDRRMIMVANEAMIPIVRQQLGHAEWLELQRKVIAGLEKHLAARPLYYGLVAGLYREAEDDEKAGDYLQAAGQYAEKIFDYHGALNYYYQAAEIALRRHQPSAAGLLMNTGRLARLLGLREPAVAAFQQAIDLGPKNISAKAHLELGLFFSALEENEESFRHLQTARSSLPVDEEDYFRAGNALAYIQMFRQRHKEAAELLDQSLAWAKQNQSPRLTADTLYLQAVQEWSRTNYLQALQIARLAHEFAGQAGLIKEQADAALLIATSAMSQNELPTAQEFLNQAYEGYHRLNRIESLQVVLINQAILSFCQGKPADAEKVLQQTLIRSRQTGNRETQYTALRTLAEIQKLFGRFDAAGRAYEQAHELIPQYFEPVREMVDLYIIKNQLDQARALLAANQPEQPSPEYFLAWADLETAQHNKTAALQHLCQADKLLNAQSRPLVRQIYWMSATHFFFDLKEYEKSYQAAQQARAAVEGYEYYRRKMDALIKICRTALEPTLDVDIKTEISALYDMGAIYDSARYQCLRLEVLTATNRLPENLRALQTELNQAEEVFVSLGAKQDMIRLLQIREKLGVLGATSAPDSSRLVNYLDAFQRLAELISQDLGEESFLHRVLNLVINVTGAERGALFVKTAAGMNLAAGLNLDQTTLSDAENLSHTAIAASDRNQLVFVPDALNDPDFNLAKSVMLNQIRSLLCLPLVINNSIIGCLYLDTRTPGRLLGASDQDFLLAVARILAAVIEKSIAFNDVKMDNALLKSNIIREIGQGYLISRSRVMKNIYRVIEDTAPTNVPVLILGETGSGKGMIARLIHLKSQRHQSKFMTINCGTIPETLLESELFGHKKGSFTGALSDKPGLLEEAEHGTVFLDEIANTSLGFQAKLLEAIEEKIIRRVGETAVRAIDVRFLFATNRDLDIEVEEGRFRKDLFYRINVFQITVPPLRERPADILRLAQMFLERFSREINKKIDGFTADVQQWLQNYYWPGNIRELQNYIERAVIQARGRRITLQDLNITAMPKSDQNLTELKKEAIEEALKKANGRVTKAAELLKINRRTIQRYIKKFHIIK